MPPWLQVALAIAVPALGAVLAWIDRRLSALEAKSDSLVETKVLVAGVDKALRKLHSRQDKMEVQFRRLDKNLALAEDRIAMGTRPEGVPVLRTSEPRRPKYERSQPPPTEKDDGDDDDK